MVRWCQQPLNWWQNTPRNDHWRQALQRLRARELITRFGAGRGRGTREGGESALAHFWAMLWTGRLGQELREGREVARQGLPLGERTEHRAETAGQGHTIRPGHTDTAGPTASDFG